MRYHHQFIVLISSTLRLCLVIIVGQSSLSQYYVCNCAQRGARKSDLECKGGRGDIWSEVTKRIIDYAVKMPAIKSTKNTKIGILGVSM